jgi:hypothetical protein
VLSVRARPGQVTLARQEVADAAVGVLGRTFLPRAVRVAEISLAAELLAQQDKGGELAAAVEMVER